jgi:protein-S-isoprenylcysteine O-methyltransferase Ste14
MDATQPPPADATAGVRVRPPLLFLACLLLGLGLDYALALPRPVPEAWLAPAIRWTAGALAIAAGALTFAAGVADFIRAETPVPTSEPVRALVTTGMHGWSRNPIYVGMFLVYAGICIGAASPWMAVLALPLAVILRWGVVAREEAYLERRFGDAYRAYKARVRRWL